MLKEIKEEIRFIIEHPILTITLVGTFTGIIPTLLCVGLFNILGI